VDLLWKTDWHQLFAPEMSLPEVLVRGTLVYVSLCLLLRVVLKRQAGKVALSDLLVVSVVAGVCRNPLVRDAYSVTDGLLVVATVLAWSFALDWMSYNVPAVHRLLHAPPVPLVRDGQVLPENLRRELMTFEQLCCKLRREGLKEPAQAAEAWMEGDGHVSVIPKEAERWPRHLHHSPPGAANGVERADRGKGPAGNGTAEALPPGHFGALADAVRRLRGALSQFERDIAQAESPPPRPGRGVNPSGPHP
jgi:uncharacterized membrane protein YcaP (DUF421 family)